MGGSGGPGGQARSGGSPTVLFSLASVHILQGDEPHHQIILVSFTLM